MDANIILDLMLKRNNYVHCEAIFEHIQKNALLGFVTPSVLQVSAHWLTKAFGAEMAKNLLLDLVDEVAVIDINKTIVVKALQMKNDDIEDNIQLTAALYYHLDYFITGDTRMAKQKWNTITIISPKDFVKLFRP